MGSAAALIDGEAIHSRLGAFCCVPQEGLVDRHTKSRWPGRPTISRDQSSGAGIGPTLRSAVETRYGLRHVL
jgi:hypothetical protein